MARAASFCNSAASNFDGFDQAISFFGGGATWLQPPGWVHAMNAATRADQALTSTGDAGGLSVSAQRTAAGDHLYVRLVNAAAAPADVALTLANWAASSAVTTWTLAASAPNGGNSFANQSAVAPVQAADAVRAKRTTAAAAAAAMIAGAGARALSGRREDCIVDDSSAQGSLRKSNSVFSFRHSQSGADYAVREEK